MGPLKRKPKIPVTVITGFLGKTCVCNSYILRKTTLGRVQLQEIAQIKVYGVVGMYSIICHQMAP